MANSPLFVKYQSGGQFNVIDQSLTTGQVFYVDSSSARAVNNVGAGQNPDYPFATIDFAIGQCAVDNGDVIYVMPNHASVMTTAGAISCDVSGIKIIGLGKGAARPTITSLTDPLGSLIATCSVWLENLIFASGVDATVNMVNIDSPDCVIKNCTFKDVTGQGTDMVVTTTNADRLLIEDCQFWQAVAAGPNSAIALVGSNDVIIRGCWFDGNYAVGAIDCRGEASLRLTVYSCKFWTANAADIAIVDTITGSTGIIGPYLSIMLTDNAANITEAITGAGFRCFDPIYVCNLAGEKGMLINWIASA